MRIFVISKKYSNDKKTNNYKHKLNIIYNIWLTCSVFFFKTIWHQWHILIKATSKVISKSVAGRNYHKTKLIYTTSLFQGT